jgi:hypothetical protein
LAGADRARLTAAEGRKFGLTVGVSLAVLGGLFLWRQHDRVAVGLLLAGGLLIAAGLAAPTRLGPVERGWMAMAHAISRVTTPIFMSIVYFVVLAPVGLLRQAVRRSPLRREAADSYWKRPDPESRGGLERQF